MARYSQDEARMMKHHLTEMTNTLDRVNQLLDDLLVIYPDLDNNSEIISFGPNGYGTRIKSEGYHRFKVRDIHIVAEGLRAFNKTEQDKKRFDGALTEIGL